jgi:hypothetical protein
MVDKPYYEPIEPDWEKPVADAALKAWKRIFRIVNGYPFPDDAIPSPAMISVIDHEMRVLVNELTEHWY